MKHNVMLTIVSLLSILFLTFHLTDDIVRGMERGGIATLFGVLIVVVWLYGTLVLAGRRAGYIIVILGSILGAGVPVVHMMGSGLVSGEIVRSGGIFFWVWTNIALCSTSVFSFILSVSGLLKSFRREPGEKSEKEAANLAFFAR